MTWRKAVDEACLGDVLGFGNAGAAIRRSDVLLCSLGNWIRLLGAPGGKPKQGCDG